MRLTSDQAETIRSSTRLHLGMQSRIWLFVSRVDDQRCGGDVDSYVEPESPPALKDRLRRKVALAVALGLNIDLVRSAAYLLIYRFARRYELSLWPKPVTQSRRTGMEAHQ